MIRAVKGTRDLLPPDTAVWNHVEQIARAVFHAYNYREIRTPILEETQLFARGVGAETDIVTKEMYTFEDRDGSSLTMRPENTAGVMRTVSPGLRSKCEIPSVSGDHDSELPHVTAEPRSDHCRPSADYEGMVGKAEA